MTLALSIRHQDRWAPRVLMSVWWHQYLAAEYPVTPTLAEGCLSILPGSERRTLGLLGKSWITGVPPFTLPGPILPALLI